MVDGMRQVLYLKNVSDYATINYSDPKLGNGPSVTRDFEPITNNRH